MTLDPALWTALEAHGVTVAHLDLLLRLLELHRNGSFCWHFVHGQVTQQDLRLAFPNRAAVLRQVSEGMLGEGNALLR